MINTYNNRFTRAFVKVIGKSGKMFSTDNSGLFKIHYENQFKDTIFNQTNTFAQLKDCPYYPKTYLVNNNLEFNNLQLENGKYFLKPKDGFMGTNVSVCEVINNHKNIIVKNNIQFPLIVQKDIGPKLINGYKVDYRAYVLFLKFDNKIQTFVYPFGNKRIADSPYSNKKEALLTLGKKTEPFKLPTAFYNCIKSSISHLQ